MMIALLVMVRVLMMIALLMLVSSADDDGIEC